MIGSLDLAAANLGSVHGGEHEEDDVDWGKQARDHDLSAMRIESVLLLNDSGISLLSLRPRIFAMYWSEVEVEVPCVMWEAQRHPKSKGKAGQIILVSADEAREIRTGRKRVTPNPKSEPGRPAATPEWQR